MDLVDDLVAGDALRLGLVGEEDAVAEDVVHDLLHVLRRRVCAAVQKRVAARGEVEREGRARARAVLDELPGLPRLEDDVEDVVADLLVAVHLLQRGPQRLDVGGRADGLRLGRDGILGEALHYAALVGLRRRLYKALEHEAVNLRLGERIRALLLDRVLGREHEERLRQAVRLVADRNLALLHRLEQRRLHLRRRAVDLVRQQQIREDRTLLWRELPGLRGIDERPHDVGRQ